MKANAPEKLYLIQHNGLVCYCRNNDEDIEYTRTDAFIERACDWLDGVLYDYIKLKHANVDTFIDVDNKRFIEDFRNYMERE